MNKLFKASKYILLIGLPCVLAGCLLIRHYYPQEAAVDWVYFTAFTGLVGIVTNTLAIRMLFHPKEPKFFGIQGLIPGNKAKIAEKIAGETEKRLLNIETIMEHIEKGRIIEETISFVTERVEDYLAQKTNRKQIADIILGFYNRYADKFFVWLTQSAEGWLSDLISRPGAAEAVWEAVKPKVKKYFESDDLRHRTSTWIIHNLIEKSPELAHNISRIMDRYIEDLVPWKKTVLKIAKDYSGLNKKIIENLLRRILHSPGTYDEVTRFIESNLQNIEAYLEQDEVHEKIEEILGWLKSAALEANRNKAIPALREKIDSFLENDSSWDIIDRYLVAVMKTLPSWLRSYLHRPENIEKIREVIPYIIKKLNIRQIVAENIEGQDTDEFEQMIMKVSGEHFAAIEVLGGVLGMLAGLTIKGLQLL
jgi:uncharacterized membrane protein YheB (UPF0754 family)